MFERLPEAGYLHAGQACYLCLRVEDVIDTGHQIEGEGILAICTNCVKDLAVSAGMDPEAEGEVEQMAAITTQLTADRDRAVGLAQKLRTQLRTEREKFAAEIAGSKLPKEKPVSFEGADASADAD
jgi:hypothetical protein